MFRYLREICEDERDKLSSTRIISVILVFIAMLLLLASLALMGISLVLANKAYAGFEFILGPTGPVVLLLGAGQAKTAVTNTANAIMQAKSQGSNIEKRKRGERN